MWTTVAKKQTAEQALNNATNTSASGAGTAAGEPDGNWQQRDEQQKHHRHLLRDIEKRNRAQLIPHYATGGLVAVAGAIHHAGTQAHALGAATLLTGAVIATTGLAGYWWLKRRQQLLAGWDAWTWAALTASFAWMVYAVAAGVSWGSCTAVLAAEAALGARWWRRHRHPIPAEADPTDQDVNVDDSYIATVMQRWDESIGNQQGVLPGSTIANATRFEHGVEFLVTLVRGKQTLDTVRANIGMIASGLDHPSSRLVAEAYEDDEGDERPSLVKLTIVAHSPIKDTVFFREVPSLRKGYLPVGPYSDGRGEASYRLYKGRRMLNGIVVGGTDSGKSRLIEQIALIAMRTGYTYVIHVDGMNGASCPALWGYAHERYGKNDVDTVLARLEAMQAYREGQLQQAAFRASPSYPGVLVIVDEFHRLLSTKDAQERWANLAREVNKCGIGILGADQDATKKTWGDGPLRASLQAGNCIGLRIKERSAGQIMDAGGFNLFNLPKRSGTGYVFDSDEAGAREAMYRGRFIPDYDDAYLEDEDTATYTSIRQVPDDVPLIEEWFAATERITLDADTDQAGGHPPAAARMRDPAVQQHRQAELTPASTGSAPATLVPMALPTIATTPEPEPEPASGGAPNLSDAQYQVLDTVRLGVSQTRDIAKQLGLSRQRVGTVLGQLVEYGMVQKTGTGSATRYISTADAVAV